MTASDDLFREDASDILRKGTERTVLDYLRADQGADAVTERPISRMSITTLAPASYVAGILAARMVSERARMMMIEYAKKARGEGTPWRELEEPLGIDPEDEWIDPSVEAFRLVANPPSMPHDPVYATWTCASCGEFIRDSGPLAGHPVDAESGHGEGCERYAREIAAYEAR